MEIFRIKSQQLFWYDVAVLCDLMYFIIIGQVTNYLIISEAYAKFDEGHD